jgi:glycosyltransferase involved in cell wall biosynthesis
MRVLYVNPLGGLGGSERSLLDLLASLHASPFDVEKKLLLFADGELGRRVRALGVDVELLPLPAALSTLGEFSEGDRRPGKRAAALARAAFATPSFVRAFRRSVSSFRPTLVHTNGMKAHVLGALAAADLPRVVHLRDFVSERPLTRKLLGFVAHRSVVVANSRAVEADARSDRPSLRSAVVYNAVDLDEFRPGPRDAAYLAALSGLPAPEPETLTVGLVATYAWWKGHKTFLAAAARVRAALPERRLRYYVVGGPVYRTRGSEVSEAELRDAIARFDLEGVVGLVPFQVDVPSVYRNLDVMVHASERPEPFGRTIVEAMASGCAVIAASAGGAVELFDERRSALGFRPGDASDLARALLELVGDAELRAALAGEGRRHVERRFGRERLAREMVAVYEALLAG